MIKLYHFDELKPEEILNRDIRAEKNVEDVVDGIIADVRARGDDALKLCRSAKPGKGCREDLYCRPRHPEAGSACMRTASFCRRKWTGMGRSLQFWAKAAASAPAPTACSKGSVRRCAAVWTARPAVCWLP